ncbi:MAG: hypothetical protein WCJ14_13945 [Verrucomicrobiota bacterium]
MQTLTHAPSTLLDLVVREGGLSDLNDLTPSQKSNLFAKLGAVQLILQAAYGTKQQIVKIQARTLHVSEQAINQWLACYRKFGFRGLVDGRRMAAKGRGSLPDVTKQWIKDEILRCQRRDAVAEVHRMVIAQWNCWRRTGDPQWAIPGFSAPPPDAGKGEPAGFSIETFRRCQPTSYQKSLASQGTISSYRSLPSILGTRVGMQYLECVLFDDQQYDVQVRVMGYDRPMRPLGFNCIDRLTAFPFPPHIRLRWFDVDAQTHKHLTQKEYVWYVIQFLCTVGYRSDATGTRLVQEHGTAKSWSNKMMATPDGFHSFEDALQSLTGGCVSMDSSGLFNKAAFAEMLYGPKSSGNPRYKAGIESFFHVVRTYQNYFIGATGRNIEMAPEDTYGIDKIERTWLKAAESLPESLREGLVSNYMTGVEFGRLAMLAYDALAARDDHNMEGWSACEFVEPVWRWEEDQPGMWRSRSTLAALPPNLRETALSQQARNPQLTTLHQWSPAEARMSCCQDPAIKKLAFQDAIHLLPTEWAKHVKVRDRHQIHITDELLPGEELIFLPELTTPRGRTEYLQPGDELQVYLNPLMPDMLLVCDMQFQFIGTVTRNVRINRSNDQLEEMFKARSRIKGALDAPVRRALQPVADRRNVVKSLNDDLITKARADQQGKPATEFEMHSAAGQKAASTRRTNEWVQDADLSAAAEAMQPSCTPAAETIPSDQIADWLAD